MNALDILCKFVAPQSSACRIGCITAADYEFLPTLNTMKTLKNTRCYIVEDNEDMLNYLNILLYLVAL